MGSSKKQICQSVRHLQKRTIPVQMSFLQIKYNDEKVFFIPQPMGTTKKQICQGLRHLQKRSIPVQMSILQIEYNE
jgi:hypothetical protein